MKKFKISTVAAIAVYAMLVIIKWIGKQFGNVWCLFIHGLARDKHKMHKAYGPEECQICGRWWSL